jgi:hypothetical protein
MKRRTLVIALAFAAVVVPSFVVAQSAFFGTSSGLVEHQSPNGPTILSESADYDSNVPINDTHVDFGHTTFSGDGFARVTTFGDTTTLKNVSSSTELVVDGQVSKTGISGSADLIALHDYAVDTGQTDIQITGSNGGVQVRLTGLPANEWIVAVSDTGRVANYTASGEVIFNLGDGAWELETHSRTELFSNPSPADDETVTTQDNINLAVDVAAPDDGTYSVAFVDASTDTTISTDTITDNGTATATWQNPDLGTNDWYVEFDGKTKSETYQFQTPATIEIRDEETEELIDGSIEVEVEFFEERGETIYTRNTTNGIINLEGLPANTKYVVSASEVGGDTYHDRKIILPDITQQGTIYLLNKSANSVDVEFLLQDQTGQFEGESSRLIIERGFQTNDSSVREFRQVAGDRFGAGDGVSVQLKQGERYQLRVANDAGQTRNLGHFEPERSQAVELTVGELSWTLGQSAEEDISWSAQRDDGEIHLQILDKSQTLTDVQVQIYETDNKSNALIYEDTFSGPYGNLSVRQPIPAEFENVTSWTVEWTGSADGETVDGRTILGQGTYPITVPVDSSLLGIFSALLLMFVAGFFSVRVAELGAIVVPVVASGLYAVGWLPLPLPWVLAGLALGVATEFASRGGFNDR